MSGDSLTFLTLGDRALRLYESGRHDAVCDTLDMLVRCGGSLNLRDLLIFGLSACHLGRAALASWCLEQARELAADAPVQLRGLVIAAESLASRTSPDEAMSNPLSVRLSQRSRP